MRPFARSSLLLVLPLLAACGDSTGPEPLFQPVELFAGCAADAPAPDVPEPARDALVGRLDLRTSDGEWAAVARRVPGGFAGYWLDESGRFTVALVDTTQRAAALAALRADPLVPHEIPVDAVVVPARWTFAQLVEWSLYLGNVPGGEPDLTMTDRNERQNRIDIGVASTAGRDRLVAAFRARGDVPCALIRIVYSAPVMPN